MADTAGLGVVAHGGQDHVGCVLALEVIIPKRSIHMLDSKAGLLLRVKETVTDLVAQTRKRTNDGYAGVGHQNGADPVGRHVPTAYDENLFVLQLPCQE